jgi:hypothetical protein
LPECHIYGIAKNKCVHQPHPSIGYYRYDADQSRRFRLRPRRGPHGRNGPVKRLYARRLLQIQPSSWYNDPYLFSLVLSLAQVQRAREKTPCQEVYFVSWLLSSATVHTHTNCQFQGAPSCHKSMRYNTRLCLQSRYTATTPRMSTRSETQPL